ncbi:MAG: MarR family transcriptional regulator [Candidatus Hydrogenedentes bacterium]|nr:MarR family transcriptional regulator [Candidatus Hydrogenedentota bacterium]
MVLTPVMQKFVLHWGEMGAAWGISRSIAQIHALLYVCGKPLPADEIAETLSIARSNVSMSLKELNGWGIVRTVHILGDRRDHFETMKSVWEMFMVVLDERKRREVDPTVDMLRECVAAAESEGGTLERERLKELLEFFDTMSHWYNQVRRVPLPLLVRLARMGDRVAQFAEKAS